MAEPTGPQECKEVNAAMEDVTGIGAFIVVSLILGVAIEIVKRRLPWLGLPYTLLVFLAATGLAMVHKAVNLGFVSNSIENWKMLDPETLLFLFLPPLLFTSAFTVEYHIFRRLMGQAVLLATAGVVIAAVLLALVAVGLFGYGWGFEEGMLFGAMFGATDPVAVVALLHELGAPETLSVMIEGESLLNDGVGFVLFLVFFEQLSGREEYTVPEILLKVLVASIGGILVGCGLGFFGLVTMQQVWGDPILSFVIMTIVVYGTFFVSEALHVSGVIGVVFLGVFFAAYSDGYIQANVLQDLKNFWRKIEFVANTLVFSFSGVIVADTLASTDTTYQANGRDVANLVMLFFLINLIRGIATLILYVPLRNMGYGFDMKQAALVSYGGLRGVVGLIAALLIFKDCSCAPGQIPSPDAPCIEFATQNRMMFHMAGIVFWTLAINGTTTKYLVNYLQLNKEGPAAKAYFEKATMKLHEHMNYVIESLKRHPHYREANWDSVWKHMPILSKGVYQARKQLGIENPRGSVVVLRAVDKLERERYIHPANQGKAKVNALGFVDQEALGPDVTVDEQLQEARTRFLELVKAAYRKQYQEGANRSWPEIQTLIEAALRCQDKPERPLQEWEESVVPYLSRFNLCAAITTCELTKRTQPTDGDAKAYEIALTFLRSHKNVVPKFKELSAENDPRVTEQVLEENRAMVAQAEAFVKKIEESSPEVVVQVKTDIAIQRLLNEMSVFSNRMLEHALINEKDHHVIDHALEESWHHLKKKHHGPSSFVFQNRQRQQKLQQQPPSGASWKDFAIFADVDRAVIDTAKSNAQRVQVAARQSIVEAGVQASGIYFIVKGTVSFLSSRGRTKARRGAGDVLGTLPYACRTMHPLRVVADTPVDMFFVSTRVVASLAQRSAALVGNIYRDAGLLILEANFPQLRDPSFDVLKVLLPNIRILRSGTQRVRPQSPREPFVVAEDQPIELYGGFLIGFHGILMEEGRRSRIPLKTVHRAFRPVAFGADTVAMFVTPQAAAQLEQLASQSSPREHDSQSSDGRGGQQDPVRQFVRESVAFNLSSSSSLFQSLRL